MKYLIAILFVLFTASALMAQLVTSPNAPANLVQNVLLGPGVTVSNINFNGFPGAIGQFTANNSNLGINSGVIITTGTIQNNGSGPHGPNNQANAGIAISENPVAPGVFTNFFPSTSKYDMQVLQFNFVPYSDTVRFKYVFGSEEFLEYCGTDYNDVFGFFISGPGIVPDGSYANYRNIARIPTTNEYVAINNVHIATTNVNGTNVPAKNPQFYVNNAGGGTIQYDGFTVPLEAVSKVECGETYHLIIAIADLGDGIYDSGIFLEANSLTSKTPVEIEHELSWEAYDDPDLMAEGCVTATFTLTRENNLNQQLVVPINLSGTATENVDYSSIPNSVTFQPGQSQIQFSFDAFGDALTEGLESILLEFVLTDPCGNLTPIVVELGIQDVQPMVVTVNDTNVVCAGDDALLTAEISGGVGPFDLLWDTGDTTESITVSPAFTQTYTVTVTDQCTGNQASGSGTVTVPQYPPIVLTASDDIVEICPYIPATLQVSASGGAGGFTYQWTSNHGQTLGQDTLQPVLPSQTTIYTVTVTDACGAEASEDVVYTITSPPLVVEISPGVEICPGDSVQILTNVTGGYGGYYYYWPHSGETTSSVWVNPMQTTSYMVVVSDECQTFSVDASTTITVVQPMADFTVSSHVLFNNLPLTFQNLTINGDTYEWDFGDGNTSTLVHPNNTYTEPGTYIVTLIATDEKGCKDTIQKPIVIIEEFYIYVPNTFTPDNDRINNTFKASTIGIKELEIHIFNRWGELVFTSKDKRFEWDGTYNNAVVQDGVFTYGISYIANNGMEGKLYGHVNLIK